jgi:hypothetical protein
VSLQSLRRNPAERSRNAAYMHAGGLTLGLLGQRLRHVHVALRPEHPVQSLALMLHHILKETFSQVTRQDFKARVKQDQLSQGASQPSELKSLLVQALDSLRTRLEEILAWCSDEVRRLGVSASGMSSYFIGDWYSSSADAKHRSEYKSRQ